MDAFFIILAFAWLIFLQTQNNELRYKLEQIDKHLFQDEIESNEVSFVNEEPVIEDKELIPQAEYNNEDFILENIEEHKPATVKEKVSFEKMFLGNIFNKVGAVALLIGFVIFIKLISPFIIFTPQLKMALGYLAGFGMMYGAFKLHNKENLENYAEVLMGTSLGTLFITTYCGYTILQLLNSTTMFCIAVALLIFSFYLADTFKRISTLVISILAAYINPLVIHTYQSITPNFLFAYLIFVNIISVVYIYKNRNCYSINIINLLLTLIYALCLFKGNNIYAPIILWAIYFIYDIITKEKNMALNYLNYIVFSILSLTVYHNNYLALGITQTVLSLGYVISVYIKLKQKREINNFIHLILIAINCAFYLFTKNHTDLRPYIYSAETLILIIMATRYNYGIFVYWALGSWIMGAVSVIPIQGVLYTDSFDNYTPLLNKRCCMLAPLFISSLLGHILLNKTSDKLFSNIAQIFKFKYISLVYLFIALEINSIINKYYLKSEFIFNFVKDMINVILGFIYTIQLKRIAIISKYILFDIASAIVGIVSFIYLLGSGSCYMPLSNFVPIVNIRVLAFLSAILTFILYSRWTKSDVYNYVAIFLGFVLIHLEIEDSLNAFKLDNFEYLLSVGWILYAGIITLCGIFKDMKCMKYSGIILCLFAIIRIFIFDLESIDILYKFIAFFTLGLILMFLSYIYNKNQGKNK